MREEQAFWITCITHVADKIEGSYVIEAEGYDKIALLYERAGGTWRSLVEADTKGWELLKRCCVAYFKRAKGENNAAKS